MAGRTTRISVAFSRAFSLSDTDGVQPAGTYRVQTVDVTPDTIDPLELETALKRDSGRQRQKQTSATEHGTVETNLEAGCDLELR